MKSLFVVTPDTEGKTRRSRAAEAGPERRKHQRRMGIPRRIGTERRKSNGESGSAQPRAARDRRGAGNRRRRPDRRIGLSPDLDLLLLGI